MWSFSIKRAYFIVTTIITSVILTGGYIIIIKNQNQESVSWAEQLICLCIALWIPSPVDYLKETMSKSRTELINDVLPDKQEGTKEPTDVVINANGIEKKYSNETIDTFITNSPSSSLLNLNLARNIIVDKQNEQVNEHKVNQDNSLREIKEEIKTNIKDNETKKPDETKKENKPEQNKVIDVIIEIPDE